MASKKQPTAINSRVGTTKIINKLYIQRELKDVPRERMEVVFSEVELHSDATLRTGRDPKIGCVQSEADKIYDDLDAGLVTVETLIDHPIGHMTIAILTDADNKIVWHDGHTRSHAIRRYKGETFKATVDAIRITEHELRVFAPQVNSKHGTNYTAKEIKAAIIKLLETEVTDPNRPKFVNYSDETLADMYGGGYVARNIANVRRALVIAKTLDLVKNKKYELQGSLTAMINKFMPAMRYGIDGVEKNISGQQKTLFASIYADDAFQGLRPEDKEKPAEPVKPTKPAAAAPETKDQPTATETEDQPVVTAEPAATETEDQPIVTAEPTATEDQPVVTAEPTATEDQPVVTAEPTATEDQPIADNGTLYAFNGVEFTVADGKVKIVSSGLIDIAAILAFADAYRMDQQSAQLFDVETVEVA